MEEQSDYRTQQSGGQSHQPLTPLIHHDDTNAVAAHDIALLSRSVPTSCQEYEKQRHDATNDRYRWSLIGVWASELLVLLAAIGMMITIAAVLQRYHGQEQPSWKYSLNLTTLVAILSTLLRISLVQIVESTTSQSKWMWFKRPQPLHHLEAFDDASRGPWGSLLMPFKVRQWNAAVIGCVVTISSLAIGPFSQQAVQSYSCERPIDGSVASVPIARIYPYSIKTGRRTSPGIYEVDTDITATILNGLASPDIDPRLTLTTTCSTGNCSFPDYNNVTYSTIGVCHKCVNITSLIGEDGKNITLPTGQRLADNHGYENYFLNVTHPDDNFTEMVFRSTPNHTALLSSSLARFALMGYTTVGCNVHVHSESED